MNPPDAPEQDERARRRQRLLAFAAMMICVMIWGLQFVMSRLAVTTTLTPTDIAILRYGVSAPMMLGILTAYGWRGGGGGEFTWGKAALLALLAGSPAILTANYGLTLAPANHASCLQPGTVAVVSTLFVVATSGARRTLLVPAGLVLAVAGLAAVSLGGAGGIGVGPWTPVGDALFILNGVAWAVYTILLARWKASPLVATAMIAVISLAMIFPMAAIFPVQIASAPWRDIVLHGFFQGVAGFTISFLLWAYAARILGPVQLGVFAPLIPVSGVLFAIPVLGEWPAPVQWLGVAGVAAGLSSIAWSQRMRFQ